MGGVGQSADGGVLFDASKTKTGELNIPSLLTEALLYVGFPLDAVSTTATSIGVAKATSTRASHNGPR